MPMKFKIIVVMVCALLCGKARADDPQEEPVGTCTLFYKKMVNGRVINAQKTEDLYATSGNATVHYQLFGVKMGIHNDREIWGDVFWRYADGDYCDAQYTGITGMSTYENLDLERKNCKPRKKEITFVLKENMKITCKLK
jgi:hypothetical protein